MSGRANGDFYGRTTIRFDQVGEGEPLVLVDGAWGHRGFGPNVKLPPPLAAAEQLPGIKRIAL